MNTNASAAAAIDQDGISFTSSVRDEAFSALLEGVIIFLSDGRSQNHPYRAPRHAALSTPRSKQPASLEGASGRKRPAGWANRRDVLRPEDLPYQSRGQAQAPPAGGRNL